MNGRPSYTFSLKLGRAELGLSPSLCGLPAWGGAEELSRGSGCTTLACFPFLAGPHAVIVFVVLVGTAWLLFLSPRELLYGTSRKFALCPALKPSISLAIVVS